ncbi:unnamed protein product [Prunus armeniaca]|uniref:Uncharacterized protein n=1 Tax=Prunus armeniaca TaxID=36596 RepID=A0A6J5XEN5_PRUAR|nr:unnamed protein product [Prunus armeniaca]CAB4312179.1 unnamed protein product [Prunus armeniaca]
MDTGEMYTDDDDDESPSEDGEPSIDADEIFTDDDDDSPSADGEPSMSPSGDGRADCSQIQGKELSTKVFSKMAYIVTEQWIQIQRLEQALDITQERQIDVVELIYLNPVPENPLVQKTPANPEEEDSKPQALDPLSLSLIFYAIDF